MRKLVYADLRPVRNYARDEISSTGIHVRAALGDLTKRQVTGRESTDPAEVSVFTGGSATDRIFHGRDLSCHPGTERNESGFAGARVITHSNGKDRRLGGSGLLLIMPNACRMAGFADEYCQWSDAADGQVMDRGAERVARGCDAV